MLKTFAAFAALTATCAAALAAGSADDVLKANKAATGGSAWDSKITLAYEGTLVGQGLTGTVKGIQDLKTGRNAGEYRAGAMAGGNGFDGTTPWAKDISGTVSDQTGGDALVLATNDAYRIANKWWRSDRAGAEIVAQGEKTDASGTYDVLTVTPKGGKPFEAWFDVKTHYLVKVVEQQGPQKVITAASDFRPVSDVVVAHKLVTDTGVGEKYLQTVTLTKIEFLGPQPDIAYQKPNVTVADYSILGGAAQTTIPIELVNNHIFGPAKVNGKGPYIFVFDTGGRNIITPPIAKELGLKVDGQLPGTGAGEGVMEAGFAGGVDFQVGDAVVKNQLALVFPLDKLGETSGVPMPGMIGYETFRRFVTRIDYGAKTLSLIDATKFDPKDAGTPIKFVFNDHVPEVTGTIEGIPAKFDIDTGSRAELTITKPFAEAHKMRASHPKGVDAVEGWGVGGPSTGYVTRIKDMTIGDVKIGPVVGSLTDQTKGAFAGADFSGNVGGGVLKRFVVTFDYNNQIMYLKPLPGPVADTGTYDRAGIWTNLGGGGFKIVAVTKTGPAEQAGLKVGDIILAVDGVPAANIKLPDLRKRLRNDAPGTVVTFKILRSDKTEDVKITLRDLI